MITSWSAKYLERHLAQLMCSQTFLNCSAISESAKSCELNCGALQLLKSCDVINLNICMLQGRKTTWVNGSTYQSEKESDPSWPAWRSALWHHQMWASATTKMGDGIKIKDVCSKNVQQSLRFSEIQWICTHSGNTAPVRQSWLGQALSVSEKQNPVSSDNLTVWSEQRKNYRQVNRQRGKNVRPGYARFILVLAYRSWILTKWSVYSNLILLSVRRNACGLNFASYTFIWNMMYNSGS